MEEFKTVTKGLSNKNKVIKNGSGKTKDKKAGKAKISKTMVRVSAFKYVTIPLAKGVKLRLDISKIFTLPF